MNVELHLLDSHPARSSRLRLPVIRLEDNSTWHSWLLERRSDGAILVHVPSPRRDETSRLPDAVFAFRDGDPQYALWAERLAAREETT